MEGSLRGDCLFRQIAAAILIAFTLGVIWLIVVGRNVATTASRSPDGRFDVSIVERPKWLQFLDRNFRVILEDRDAENRIEVFQSADQSTLIEQEFILWSDDSKRFALLGDRYYSSNDAAIGNGFIVFMVYDTETSELWCNSDSPFIDLQPISADDAALILDTDFADLVDQLLDSNDD